jgi:hypothetical protein
VTQSAAPHPDLQAFLNAARARVTVENIRHHVPNDPGWPGYVRVCEEMRRTGSIPEELKFDLTETISLTCWGDPATSKDPDGLRAFRNFTNAAAMILVSRGWTDGDLIPHPNCLAANLLTDADRRDSHHLGLLRNAFAVLIPILKADTYSSDGPYLIFGEMLLAQWLNDFPAAARAAASLIKEERSVRHSRSEWLVKDERFLLGLSYSPHGGHDWLSLAESLTNPLRDPDVERVTLLLNDLRPPIPPPRRSKRQR